MLTDIDKNLFAYLSTLMIAADFFHFDKISMYGTTKF